jgi:hypothetical protein
MPCAGLFLFSSTHGLLQLTPAEYLTMLCAHRPLSPHLWTACWRQNITAHVFCSNPSLSHHYLPRPACRLFLALSQETGLAHAGLVFEFYLAGAFPPSNTPNIWYLPGGCASKLYSLIATGTQGASVKQIHALARVIAKFIEKLKSDTTDPNFGLGTCAPDIPAVLVSLFTTSCPSRNYLWNPLVGTDFPNSPKAKVDCTHQVRG